ncbi:unnamed protein product [Ectocarpus fasciculatus]
MYRYVIQSLRAFGQDAFEIACERSATRGQSGDDGPCEEARGGASLHGDPPQAEEVANAMAAGIKDGLIEFGHLQEAVDRPNIRTGVGGLIVNMSLAFQKAAKGDTGAVLERLGRCVEVFERYPGVSRCMVQWCHLAHTGLAALAAIDDPKARGLYNRLRDVYNPSRPPASLPAPPFEEWRGISAVCDDFQCRLTQGIIASQALGVFSTPPHCTSNCAGVRRAYTKEEKLTGKGVILEEVTSTIIDAPCSTTDTPMASNRSWEMTQEPAPQISRPSRSSSSTSNVHRELGRRGASDTDIISGVVEGCGVGVSSGSVAPLPVPDMSLRSSELREVGGTTQETEDDEIAAADWLDVTHAMLKAFDDDGPAC